METKLERAEKIVKLLGYGKVWTGGTKVRIYFSGNSGYIEIDAKNVNCSKLNHTPAFMRIRDAGLLVVDRDLTDADPKYNQLQKAGLLPTQQRNTCINCDITTHILLGRGYCQDCYGECD